MPRIGSISAAGDLRVNITWSRGIREGITEEINLAPIIDSQRFFRPLRSNPKLFATVHPIVYGAAVAWGDDDDIDLSADAILRLALESMDGDELRAFIRRQDLSETALAAILGYSRRQIVGFINEGRVIPRVVSLACRYVELVNPSTDTQPQQSTHSETLVPLKFAAYDHTPANINVAFFATAQVSGVSSSTGSFLINPTLPATSTRHEPQLADAA